MARLVFGMNQSPDGCVDHMAFAPGPGLEGAIRRLKARRNGEIEVAGTPQATSLQKRQRFGRHIGPVG